MGAIVAIPNVPCDILFLFLERRRHQPAAIFGAGKTNGTSLMGYCEYDN